MGIGTFVTLTWFAGWFCLLFPVNNVPWLCTNIPALHSALGQGQMKGHGAFSMVRLYLCFCMGRNFPEVQSFPSIRASHLWPPKRLGSSRNSTVPSVGFLTL